MPVQDTARIPLRAQNGSIRAYALVDAVDSDWLNQWRWSFQGGYAYRTVRLDGGKRRSPIYMHRAILGLSAGDGFECDHKNRDRLDNRRENLRKVPKGVNIQNQMGRVRTSAHRGVAWDKQRCKWESYLSVRGKKVKLGRFASEIEAADTSRKARLVLMNYSLD